MKPLPLVVRAASVVARKGRRRCLLCCLLGIALICLVLATTRSIVLSCPWTLNSSASVVDSQGKHEPHSSLPRPLFTNLSFSTSFFIPPLSTDLSSSAISRTRAQIAASQDRASTAAKKGMLLLQVFQLAYSLTLFAAISRWTAPSLVFSRVPAIPVSRKVTRLPFAPRSRPSTARTVCLKVGQLY